MGQRRIREPLCQPDWQIELDSPHAALRPVKKRWLDRKAPTEDLGSAQRLMAGVLRMA